MKLAVQRVNSASVEVKGRKVGKIGKGIAVLLGVGEKDTLVSAEAAAVRLSKLRVMADEKGKMNLSVLDVGAEVLLISQFTLYADTSGGNRPSFISAAKPERAQKIYEGFISSLKGLGVSVQTGTFGEYMKIRAELDGPVTIILEI